MTLNTTDKTIRTIEDKKFQTIYEIKEHLNGGFYGIATSTINGAFNTCMAISDDYKTASGAQRWVTNQRKLAVRFSR